MHPLLQRTAAFAVAGLLVAPAARAQHTAMPAGMTHEEHMAQMKKDAEMNERGALAMGFDQEKTVHHFVLYDDGGAIDVAVMNPSDQENLRAIRQHLREIAGLFKAGDFGKPALTHAQQVPGTADMTRLKDALTYEYADTPAGGQVRIATADRDALAAVHAFLRFQIEDHHTGDPVTISHGGGDHRPGEAMKGREADTGAMAEMSVIHELFMSHARITRTVTNLPDGVRTVTASDDARIAALLKGHVSRMNVLVDAGRDPNLPMESPALRTLFRKFATIRTSSKVTATGVVVTQTSSDPETVAALQQHASEVTTFVDQGMAAMHDAMMKSGHK
jgi:hypothetical protein